MRGDQPLRLGKGRLALRCERDRIGPLVLHGLDTQDQPPLDQLIQHGTEIGLLNAKGIGDVALIAAGIVRDDHENGILRGPDVYILESRNEVAKNSDLRPSDAITDMVLQATEIEGAYFGKACLCLGHGSVILGSCHQIHITLAIGLDIVKNSYRLYLNNNQPPTNRLIVFWEDIVLDPTILLFLAQDGVTNGAIYALLGVALVLVFAVTRTIFIPQGEFVAYGALTYALLEVGKLPGTVYLLALFGVGAFLFDLYGHRQRLNAPLLLRQAVTDLVVPAVLIAITLALAGRQWGSFVNFILTVMIVAPLGPLLYRVAYQPMADASVLTLLIASVGVHLAMVGMGLVFFGAEGLRAPALSSYSLKLGPLMISGQSLAVYVITILVIAALFVIFGQTRIGKALRATAVNRTGARLVGISTALSGRIAFALAAVIGAVSGILIVPTTTVYYDSGFLIGLKGFVAAIIGGLASYPMTAIAAIFVGFIEALASFEASNYKEVIVFMLIIPVLLFRSFTSVHVEDEED